MNCLMSSDRPKPNRAGALAAEARARRLLKTADRVDAVEALLINLYKPPLNEQHVEGLDLGGNVLKKCRTAGLDLPDAGLLDEAAGGRTYTAQVPAQLEQALRVCL